MQMQLNSCHDFVNVFVPFIKLYFYTYDHFIGTLIHVTKQAMHKYIH